MVAAVAPYIDGAISKTVNAPEDCIYDDFEAIYRQAWHQGLKGVTAFRPNRVLGAVLRRPGELEPRLRHCTTSATLRHTDFL
jgi:ribonucleoside-diphosphate reductase alpha chain